MRIGHLSIFRFFVERFVPCITGGYTFYKDQPDIIFWFHTLIYIWLYILPLVFVMTNLKGMKSLKFIHTTITAFLFMVIKIVNYYLHQQFDKNNHNKDKNNNISNNLIDNEEIVKQEEDFVPPFGISKEIWNIRDRITDFTNVDINTVVTELIQQGYNTNDLFHFFEVYQSGQLSNIPEKLETETYHPTIPTQIKFLCFTKVITWSRKDLERWFDRPISWTECIFVPIAAFLCGILGFFSVSFVSLPENALLFLTTASAQFALIKSPNPDSFAVSQGRYTLYSRAFHVFLYSCIFNVLVSINGDRTNAMVLTFFEYKLKFYTIILVVIKIVRFLILTFPFLNALGFFGSTKDSWLFFIDIFRQILYGQANSISFYSGAFSMIIDILIHLIFSLLLVLSIKINSLLFNRLVIILSSIYGFFAASYFGTPILTQKVLKRSGYVLPNKSTLKYTLCSLLSSFATGFIILILMQFKFTASNIYLSATLTISLISYLLNHIIFQELISKNPFNIFVRPFFKPTKFYYKYMNVINNLEHYLFIPFLFAGIIHKSENHHFGFGTWVESFALIFLIINCSCLSFRNPKMFTLVLLINSLCENFREFPIFQMYICFIILWKVCEFKDKIEFLKCISSFHSIANTMQLAVFILMIANVQLSLIVILVSCLMTSPIIPFLGSSLFIPSYSRPTSFWTDQNQNEEKQGDSVFYRVISNSLSKCLSKAVLQGRICNLEDNSFYLICDDYFNAIIHIISTGNRHVIFQLRGLEITDQTLCHRNELNVIRNGIEDMESKNFLFASITTFPIYYLSKVFYTFTKCFGVPPILSRKEMTMLRSCCWKTILDDFPLNSYKVYSFHVCQLFYDRNHQNMIFIALIRVLTFFISENSYIIVPKDFKPMINKNITEQLTDWFIATDKVDLKNTILSVASVMNEAMNKISGDFDWKLYQYFSSESLDLTMYPWIPCSFYSKLKDAFRLSVGIAVNDAWDLLPPDLESLIQFVKDKINYGNLLPENDIKWTDLVSKKSPLLETLRQSNDDGGVTIKYIMFVLQEQNFKLIKINPQVVTGIWAEQINETIYFEVDDRERSTIQYDQFTLRNIISQSVNSPTGYPETVCPITFSF